MTREGGEGCRKKASGFGETHRDGGKGDLEHEAGFCRRSEAGGVEGPPYATVEMKREREVGHLCVRVHTALGAGRKIGLEQSARAPAPPWSWPRLSPLGNIFLPDEIPAGACESWG